MIVRYPLQSVCHHADVVSSKVAGVLASDENVGGEIAVVAGNRDWRVMDGGVGEVPLGSVDVESARSAMVDDEGCDG